MGSNAGETRMKALQELLKVQPDGSIAFDESAWLALDLHAQKTNPFWKTARESIRRLEIHSEDAMAILAAAMLEATELLAARILQMAERATATPMIIVPEGTQAQDLIDLGRVIPMQRASLPPGALKVTRTDPPKV